MDPIVVPGDAAATPELSGAEPRPSLRRNSLARLVADVVGLGLSLVAATVTARLLGPEGKGYSSSLTLLATLIVHCFSAGLGEAAIVMAGQKRTTLQRAASASMAASVPLGLAAAAVCGAAGYLILGADGREHVLALALAGLLVATMVGYTTEVGLLLAQERVSAVAALAVTMAALTTLSLGLFLGVLGMDVGGAMLAGVAGSSTAMVAGVVLLRRGGLSPRPAWAGDYLRMAARLGIALQSSNILVAATARLDLVLVYRLDNAASAGAYSVALTVGTLVGSVPVALAYVSFPRLANVDEEDARSLTAQVVRVGVAAALVSAAGLVCVTPIAVPLMFGTAFRAAVVPTLLLIPGGVLWSAQWLVARAMAARGATRPLIVSFLVSFISMIALDFGLNGRFGERGAACAALAASALGVTVACSYYRRQGALRDLLPRPADGRELVSTLRAFLTRR